MTTSGLQSNPSFVVKTFQIGGGIGAAKAFGTGGCVDKGIATKNGPNKMGHPMRGKSIQREGIVIEGGEV